MALALNNLKRVDMPLNKETKPNNLWRHYMDADKTHREKARRELHKNAMSYIEQILEATPHEKNSISHL